jgi:DNA primase
MAYPPSWLSKLKESVSVFDVVSEVVQLKKSGSRWVGLCPFHGERTPSFSVNPEKNLFYCFGCHEKGDSIEFMMKVHNLTFPEAVEELATRANMPLPAVDPASLKESKEQQENRRKAQLFAKLNRYTSQVYQDNLRKSLNSAANRYLAKRNIREEWIQKYYLGTSLPAHSPSALAETLARAKAPLDVAETVGLVRRGRVSGDWVDFFRNRLIFPIADTRGRVIGFGGRILDGEGPANDQQNYGPKYLNSPESLLYQKAKSLYGIFQALPSIRQTKQVLIVEGYFDVIGMAQAGFENTVAVSGTALSEFHLDTIRRVANEWIVLFDGDRAGQRAQETSMVQALRQGMFLKGVFLPEKQDPDEIVSQPAGREWMKEAIDKAPVLLDHFLEEMAKDLGVQSLEDRTESLKKIGFWLSQIPDELSRKVREEWLYRKHSVSPEILRASMKGQPSVQHSSSSAASSSAAPANIQNSHSQNTQARYSDTGNDSRGEKKPFQKKSYADWKKQKFGPPPGAPLPKTTSSAGKLAPIDKVLLQALLEWKTFGAMIASAQRSLPPSQASENLFIHPDLRKWAKSHLHDPLFLGQLKDEPDSILKEGLFPPVAEGFLQETLRVPPDGTGLEAEVRLGLERRVKSLWMEYAQELRTLILKASENGQKEEEIRLQTQYQELIKNLLS